MYYITFSNELFTEYSTFKVDSKYLKMSFYFFMELIIEFLCKHQKALIPDKNDATQNHIYRTEIISPYF